MQQKLRRRSELAALYQVVMSSSACTVRVFLVVLVFYGVCGHNIVSSLLFRFRIFIVSVQVYKEICLTAHSRKYNKK